MTTFWIVTGLWVLIPLALLALGWLTAWVEDRAGKTERDRLFLEVVAWEVEACRQRCSHSGAVAVTSVLTDELVAWLCPDCDEQLAPTWQKQVREYIAMLSNEPGRMSLDDFLKRG